MYARDLENWIRDYIVNIDFAKENFSIKKIKEDLRQVLDSEPAVQVQRVKYSKLNEATNQMENEEKISTVTICYIDGETDKGQPILKRLPIIVG